MKHKMTKNLTITTNRKRILIIDRLKSRKLWNVNALQTRLKFEFSEFDTKIIYCTMNN